ncbi:Nuclear envelope morphology protein 1 [Erysiphe neolycopersici]|uniref:Nuclear envelope morphology protein 1 n=1 Tax=Erysiphe neolycopersici TaxID=212602 RepID=A0A420HYI6_9PEZI|nr:Nuclear envelope morphology protein 1 [Erysiphe neolycopersici]
MNSLNLLSGRVSAPQSPGPSRSSSYGNLFSSATTKEFRRNSRDATFNEKEADIDLKHNDATLKSLSEESSQLEKLRNQVKFSSESQWLIIPKSLSMALANSIRCILSTLSAPVVYILASMYDENGVFAPVSQITKLGIILCGGSRRTSTAQALGLSSSNEDSHSLSNQSTLERRINVKKSKNPSHKTSLSSSEVSSISEFDDRSLRQTSSIRQRLHDNLSHNSGINSPNKYSVQVKLQDNDTSYNRKHQKISSASIRKSSQNIPTANEITASLLKSPVSPASSSLTSIYTNYPAPPRPLLSLRQPTYTLQNGQNSRVMQKTLILDLDETLIHSMAKGGKMSTGNMVEVRLNTVLVAGENTSLGLQHPILYWVNKRPHCDEFLRLVCKWYNLIIFTASVQEYADPVIDLLEQDRKLFSGRYYRQHCTQRLGAYIKDLSLIEPDLSKVMILDNSPLSYMFHQENAIPIEGWINDPTDNALLHLIPLLESLQYVTDVRTFLGLRGGEDGKLF